MGTAGPTQWWPPESRQLQVRQVWAAEPPSQGDSEAVMETRGNPVPSRQNPALSLPAWIPGRRGT